MKQDLPRESDRENLYLIKIKKCSQYCRILAFSLGFFVGRNDQRIHHNEAILSHENSMAAL